MSMRNLARHVRVLKNEVASLEVPQDLAERFEPYRDRPVAFVKECLGADPEPYQVELLEAAASEPRIAWRAAHGVGKTATLAWLLLWWLLTRPFSRVLVLAPAFERQIGRYLLPEVKKWARNAQEPLPILVRANTVEVEGYGREWFALGIQASDSTMVEGGHAESLCVLADEAKGLDAEVVAALHGTQTDAQGDRLYVLASVPGGPSGPFFDVFRKGGKLWRTLHTSAAGSSLVSPTWVEERREEWGEGSPLFQARVLGDFPEEAEGTLFRLSDLEAAVGRVLELPRDQPSSVSLGLDVARFGGDRSALAVWEGYELVEILTRRGLDTMETAAWAASEVNRRHPYQVLVDEIGVGSGVLDRLLQMGHTNALGVNVSRRASAPDLFINERAERYWRLREALERGEVCLPEDEGLIAELSSVRFQYDTKGRIQIEKKDAQKKRVGHSPDLADATVLGFPGVALVPEGFYYEEIIEGGFFV